MQRKALRKALSVLLALAVMLGTLFTGITVVADDSVYEAKRITIHPGIDDTYLNFSWHSDTSASSAAVRIKIAGSEEWTVFTGECEAVVTSADGYQEGYHDTFVSNCGHTCSSICGHKACTSSQCYHGTYAGPYYNRVTVGPLEYGKEYTYQLGDGTNWSGDYTTRIADTDPDEGFSYLVFGDSQTADQYYGDYMKNALELSVERFPDADFFMNLGDNIHENNDRNYDAYFTAQDILAKYPMAVVMGNHELNLCTNGDNVNFADHPALTYTNPPAADERQDYWFRYGDVLFITFNSGPQRTGMMEDLDKLLSDATSAHPDARWTILQTHQGFYSNNGGGRDWRRNFVPVISKYDIDLVFNGHHHIYTRTESLLYEASSCSHSSTAPYWSCENCTGYVESDATITATAPETFVASDGVTTTDYTKTTERTDPEGITYIHLDSLTAEGHDQYITAAGSELRAVNAFSINTVEGQGAITKVSVTEDELKVETFWINNGGTPRIGNSAALSLLDDDYIDATPYDTYTIKKTTAVKDVEVTFDGGTDRGIFTRRINSGETVAEPADPIMKGKSFKYWTADGETAFDFATTLTEDTTLTAVYEDIPPTTTAELFKEAIARGDSEIVLAADIELNNEGNIVISSNTTIKSAEGQQYTLKLNSITDGSVTHDSSRLTVATGYTVRLENIKVDVAEKASFDGYYYGFITVRHNAKLYVKDCHLASSTTNMGGGSVALIKIQRQNPTNGYVEIENSTLVTPSTATGCALNGVRFDTGTFPTFRLIDTTVSGNWAFNGPFVILEGTSTHGWCNNESYIYDFRESSVKAARIKTGEIELSKLGSGVAATNENYKIYYSFDEAAFKNGTATEYTAPIADVGTETPIYVALGRSLGNGHGVTKLQYATVAEKYCGEYIEGTPAATADALVSAVANGESVITLTDDITLLDQSLTLGTNTVIQSKQGAHYTLTLDGSSRITVASGKTATLQDMDIIVAETADTLDSDTAYYYGYITVSSNAKLYVRNCHLEAKAANMGCSTASIIKIYRTTSAGYVEMHDCTMKSPTGQNKGVCLNGVKYSTAKPTFRLVNTTLSGNWTVYSAYFLQEGTTSIGGYTTGTIYDFRNVKVRAVRNAEGNIELSKVGTGTAATSASYYVYYATSADAFANGTATQYTEPISGIDVDTPIYVAVGVNTTFTALPTEKYCGPYGEGVTVGNEAELLEALSLGEDTITLTADIDVTDNVIAPYTDTVIKSKQDSGYTLNLNGSAYIKVPANTNLTLDGVNVKVAADADTIDTNVSYSDHSYITVCDGAGFYANGSRIESLQDNLGSSTTALIRVLPTTGTPGYVCLKNSYVGAPTAANKGIAVSGTSSSGVAPTFRFIDTTVSGNWVLYEGYAILEGTTAFAGYGYTHNATLIDFRNTTVSASASSSAVELSKTGSGTAVSLDSYKIYYADEFFEAENGDVTEYSEPFSLLGTVPKYTVIGYTHTNGKTFYSSPIAITPYTISVTVYNHAEEGESAVYGGTVTGGGKTFANSSCTLEITPAAGWYVSSVTVDGSAVSLDSSDLTLDKANTYTIMEVSADAEVAVTFKEIIKIVPGASIRLKDTAALRFRTEVSGEFLADLDAKGIAYTLGTLVLPENLVPTEGLTLSTAKVKNIVRTQWQDDSFDHAEGYKVMTGVLGNIPESNYSRVLAGRAYITFGEETLYTAETVARSLAQVAYGAVNDPNRQPLSNYYTEDQITKLTEYAAAYTAE